MIQINTDFRPQVLLLGNGMNRTFGGISWSDLMGEISVRTDIPAKLTCPMPLQAVLVTNDKVGALMKKHKASFYGTVSPELAEQLHKLLAMGFDDILTTNYSYELEAASCGNKVITDSFLRKTCKNIRDGERVEPKYMLRTCQMIKFHDVSNRIWHIHGEARKPDSMILGHYYYANMLCRMKNYVDSRYASYAAYSRERKNIELHGWLDSFILGDVYMLGFGMDFSELDLWWLINRKKREGTLGPKIHFYEMGAEEFNEKHELLSLMNVEIHTLGMIKPQKDAENSDAVYREFYSRAISDIHSRMSILSPV